MALKITRKVGKNAHGQSASDVKVIQMALAAIKNKKYKPYYCDKIDGKQNDVLVEAIMAFQLDNKIRITGNVEPTGPTLQRLNNKIPMSMKKAETKLLIPTKYTGASLNEARMALLKIADDAAMLLEVIKRTGELTKITLTQDSDKDGKVDSKLYKKLKKFDRWLDIIEGRVKSKGVSLDGVMTRLQAI